ncbi:DUF2505 domain-containing protein [Mycobacterium sp. CVI_P3]|uniref:DUF2505 domain-containing protein n=1 Tax=Mycobacterium pinniadriaticum TaxID=2994102 RepID=A0ABT3SJH9_9MYCO|nr:DUF2505 domain-containing protein [Mycobacterium pinniadriaticum]MCX2933259.1 DUF2505 domain-containing protein [Mycobacterium pinniadriaticum]MCX2939681.1 DUF2505 domain-containing protein [Mycobacterium pinniadriaticum]
MPRSFDMATDYEGSVKQVHQALRNEQYWLARLADSGADDATLNSLELTPDGGVEVSTTQLLRADRLPAVVTQFHHGDLEIRRAESWTGLMAGQAEASVSGSIPGAPVMLTGSAQLAPSDLRARLAFRATVEVRIPLVGGKVENFIGNQLVDLLIAEQRFTTRWIAENG